ncbi:MAG: hypothetical protein ACLFP9_04445 [Desulfonatronovibrio sp.]
MKIAQFRFQYPVKREEILFRPEGGLKDYQWPLAMAHAIKGFRPMIARHANRACPVQFF